jgi:hypothetical protein
LLVDSSEPSAPSRSKNLEFSELRLSIARSSGTCCGLRSIANTSLLGSPHGVISPTCPKIRRFLRNHASFTLLPLQRVDVTEPFRPVGGDLGIIYNRPDALRSTNSNLRGGWIVEQQMIAVYESPRAERRRFFNVIDKCSSATRGSCRPGVATFGIRSGRWTRCPWQTPVRSRPDRHARSCIWFPPPSCG